MYICMYCRYIIVCYWYIVYAIIVICVIVCIVWKNYEYIFNKKCINCKRIMNKLWTILCMNCKYNMYSLWMKYEQIVNKIIFILFFRTYIEARYIGVRYIMPNWTIKSVKWNCFTYPYYQCVKCFYLTKYPIIKLAKMQKIQVIVIFSPISPIP